jgi:YgiT-type zinc finger domain-containing protein
VETLKCEECGIGHYRTVNANYITPFGKRMLIIPDAPAYICDVCSHRCFNVNFVFSVHYLIHQAMKGSQRATQKRQPAKNELPVWQQSRRSRQP